MISGFVFDEEDFVRPWEVQSDNLERFELFTTAYESSHYILQGNNRCKKAGF